MNQTPSLSFMEAVKKCFANYANFKGRARRSEFWWWMLFTYIVNCVLYIPVLMLFAKKQALINEGMNVALQGGDLSAIEAQDPTTMLICFCVLLGIVSLILLIPSLAVMCRRLHDVGKSGKLMWLFLLCGIGYPICLILCIPDGNPQPNQYGPSPKYTE